VATVRLQGFKELERTLANLPRATAKNVGVRTLKDAARPVDEAASALAPEDTSKLESSVVTGTRLTARQRGRIISKNYVEMHIGTVLGRGMFTNFGTFKDPPQMWFDRAWAGTQGIALDIIKDRLWQNVERAATRYSKKLARGA
jgi:hypothetical protein